MSPILEDYMNELTTNAQTEIAIPTAALELVETSVSPNTCRAYSSIWHRFAATGLEGQVQDARPRLGRSSLWLLEGLR